MKHRGSASIRQKLGCWIHERWRTELVLRLPRISAKLGFSWLDLRNRFERLSRDDRTAGRICDWRDSSALIVSRAFPDVGLRLLREATRAWPIDLGAATGPAMADGRPLVSILIPIGGTARLSQFKLALASARSQKGIATEVIVVEQSRTADLANKLPSDVRYVHQVPDESVHGFNKSWALNRAAREASGEILVLLDGDYLLPEQFASECHRILRLVEGVRPTRFIFYLDEHSTLALSRGSDLQSVAVVEEIVANNPTPIAVRCSTYWEIGGHDEAYVGWGGEDTEFLDRLRTRSVAEGGWMPVLHAWHPAAPKKESGHRNRELHDRTMAVPAEERIRRLTVQAERVGSTISTSPAGSKQ